MGGIVGSNLHTKSTYVFIECDGDWSRGCSLFLRGGDRPCLNAVKELLQFAILFANHLILESAFYLDRNVGLPLSSAGLDEPPESASSSDDEEVRSGEACPHSRESRPRRYLHSLSLEVDYGSPCLDGIITDDDEVDPDGGNLFEIRSALPLQTTLPVQRSIVVTSVLMSDTLQQTNLSTKRLTFYGQGDTPLGMFLINQCFQPKSTSPALLNRTLIFAHKPGTVDISVRRLNGERLLPPTPRVPSYLHCYLPIYFSVFCKECGRSLSEETPISEGTWKLSFGKFLDILFYNKTATGGGGHCTHRCRDNHILHFSCMGYLTSVEFTPHHSFSISLRSRMPLPETFHRDNARSMLLDLKGEAGSIFDEFKTAVLKLDQMSCEIRELHRCSEPLSFVVTDLKALEADMKASAQAYNERLSSSIFMLVHEPLSKPLSVDCRFPFAWKFELLEMTAAWSKQLQDLFVRLEDLRQRPEFYTGASSLDVPRAPLRLRDEQEDTDRRNSMLSSEVGSPRSEGLSSFDDRDDMTKERTRSENEGTSNPESTISRAIALLLGTDNSYTRGRTQWADLPRFSDPSICLPCGKKGEILPVKEKEPISVVAYALCSRECGEQMRRYLVDEGLESYEPETGQLRLSSASIERISPVNLASRAEDAGIGTPINGRLSFYGPENNFEQHLDTSMDHEDAVPKPVYSSTLEAAVFSGNPSVQENDSEGEAGEEETEDATTVPDSSTFERQMILQRKTHSKLRFSSVSTRGQSSQHMQFLCTIYWSTQFFALRRVYFNDADDDGFIQSLTSTVPWMTEGGKSGATFSKSTDGRFVMKIISRTELYMFNDFAPAYFEYMSKAMFHGLPTVLCKIFGLFQVAYYSIHTKKKVTSFFNVLDFIAVSLGN